MRLGCIILLATALVGCQLDTPRMMQTQHSYDQQVEAILKVVPVGTERAEAIRRLEQAGVQGAFGISQSIYYCNEWKRDGDKQKLDVALLFNEEGRLYSTRHGDTAFAIEKPGGQNVANRPSSTDQSAGSNEPTAAPVTTLQETSAVRTGLREPFRTEK